MATIESTAIYEAVSGTSHTVTLPSGIVAGDLLVMLQSNDQTPALRDVGLFGWNRLIVGTADGVDSGRVLWRIADGTEDGSRKLVVSSTESVNCVTYRISGANTIVAVQDELIGRVPYDPIDWPALSFGATVDAVVIRCEFYQRQSTAPSGYTVGPVAGSTASSQSSAMTYYKSVTGASSEASVTGGSPATTSQLVTLAVYNVATGGTGLTLHPLAYTGRR